MNTKTTLTTLLLTITLLTGCGNTTATTNENLINNSQVTHRGPKTTNPDGTTQRTITLKTTTGETHTCTLTYKPENTTTTADTITCDTNHH